MSKKLRILIINDDGIEAPGLKHLWGSVVDFADVRIIAPAIEQSGVGMATTQRKPLHIHPYKWEKETPAWKISGTPADCVKMAMSVILDYVPDLILSGINRGANSGRNVLYSGTVGGVIEGVLRKIPGIAFSCVDYENPNFAAAAKYVMPIVNYVLEHPLPFGSFLNVNVPNPADQIKGVKFARQGLGYWTDNPDQRLHPEGRTYYWLGGKWSHHEEDEFSDVRLLNEGYLTAVPINVKDMTDHDLFHNRREHFESLFIDLPIVQEPIKD
jgi:5'-nucleotidase